jgi:hypothetical protein
MEKPTLAEAESKSPSSISGQVRFSSESAADREFFVSFGVIMSCRLGEVDRIRESIEIQGGRIVFQTVSNGPLFLLRQGQIDRALAGDLSALAEIHLKKRRVRK